MPNRRLSLVLAILMGLLVGGLYPFVDLALACRDAASEACVWGKAYLPLTLGLSLVLVGGATGAVLYAVLAHVRRRKSPGG